MSAAMTTTPIAVTTTDAPRDRARTALQRCGATLPPAPANPVAARTPITGDELFEFPGAGRADVESAIAAAKEAFATWQTVPPPVRGALVKRLGALLAEHKED